MSFYKLEDVNSFTFTCPYCLSESITFRDDDSEPEPLLIDGESLIHEGIEFAIGGKWNASVNGWSIPDGWDFGYRTVKKCPICKKYSIFIEAILVAATGNRPWGIWFNEDPGVESLIKVACDGIKIQHKLKYCSRYLKSWVIFEYKSKELSPMQQHLFGPYPYKRCYLDLGSEILKEIWPTLVTISETRQGEWEFLYKNELQILLQN